MAKLLRLIDPLLVLSFRAHDLAARIIATHLVLVKRLLRVAALLSLGILIAPFRDEVARNVGEIAANLLIVILFISPLAAFLRMRFLLLLMSLRRELGILMGALAIVHGASYLPLLADVGPYPVNAFLFSGLLALLLTLPLLLTSNNFSTKLLGPNWKRLHRLVYLVLLAAIVHRYFAVGGGPGALVEALALLGGYTLLKLLEWKRALFPPLTGFVDLIALRYAVFRMPGVPDKPAAT